MKIEIWSDIVCPFCYIGKRKLEAAMENFPHAKEIEIEFKSYQLDPNTPKYNGQDFYESMSKKFGSIEKVKEMTAGIAQQAKLVGLDFNFDNSKPTNTFDAHRITKFAKAHGKDTLISEKLLYAHFTAAEDVGNIETLANIAADVGLDRNEALAVLKDEQKYADDVLADIHQAQQYQISGVPYFIINQKYAISGAQPTEVFAGALEKVWEEENPKPVFENLSTDDSGLCADGSCSLPPETN